MSTMLPGVPVPMPEDPTPAAEPPEHRRQVDTVVAAIDAGNTKTDALIARVDGTVLAWSRAGGGDIHSDVEPGAPEHQVRLALEGAAAGAEVSVGSIAHTAMRLAGIDWPEDESHWRHVIEGEWPDVASYSLLNDGYASIRIGSSDGVGLAITAGTGGAFAARSRSGAHFSLGMRGPHQLAAKGLGIAGYQAVALANLGVAPATALTEHYLRFFGVGDVEDIVHLVTARGHAPVNPVLARTAPLVADTARAGDPVARGIVTREAELLALYARATASRVGASPGLPIILSGSTLVAAGSPLADEVGRCLQRDFPRSPVIVATLPAVCGALLDALSEFGMDVGSLCARIEQTLPTAPTELQPG